MGSGWQEEQTLLFFKKRMDHLARQVQRNIDDDTVAEFVLEALGTIESGDDKEVTQLLEAYVSAEASVEILDCMRQVWEQQAATNEATSTENASLFTKKPAKPVASNHKVQTDMDTEARETILRLARMQEDADMALADDQLNPQEQAPLSLAQLNRGGVQHKLLEAQKARVQANEAHQALSRAAAQADRKKKEDKKLERQNNARKGERRGNG